MYEETQYDDDDDGGDEGITIGRASNGRVRKSSRMKIENKRKWKADSERSREHR
jgi:hypothetical protein